MLHAPEIKADDRTRFSIDAAEFYDAVTMAKSWSERRAIIPILGMVKIDFIGSTVRVLGTNLDIEGETLVQTGCSAQPFSFTCQPGILQRLLRGAKGTATVEKNDDAIIVYVDGITANLRELCPLDDWPRITAGSPCIDENGNSEYLISESTFHTALSAVSPYISKDETRYYLNGIYMAARENGQLRMVATDGHRMGIYDTDIKWPLPSMIVPISAVRHLLKRTRKGSNKTLIIAADRPTEGAPPQLSVNCSICTMKMKTIDGTYPDYERVIPKGDISASITLTRFAINRLPVSDAGVTLNPEAGTMIAQDIDAGATVSAPIQGHGKPVTFNTQYLTQMAASSDVLRIDCAGPQGSSGAWKVFSDDVALTRILMSRRN